MELLKLVKESEIMSQSQTSDKTVVSSFTLAANNEQNQKLLTMNRDLKEKMRILQERIVALESSAEYSKKELEESQKEARSMNQALLRRERQLRKMEEDPAKKSKKHEVEPPSGFIFIFIIFIENKHYRIVTIVFSDVENSTILWEAQPEAMAVYQFF